MTTASARPPSPTRPGGRPSRTRPAIRCSPRCRIRTTCASPSSALAVGARRGRVGAGRLERLPRLPVRALHRPWHDVLEPAEHGAAVAGVLGEPEAVGGLDGVSAPRAPLIGAVHCGRTLLGGRLPGDARPAPDYRARGGPDGPGAAGAGPAGAGPGRLRRRRSSSSTTTCPWRIAAGPATRSCWRRHGRCARPVTASRPPPSRPRAPTTSAARTRSCARQIDGRVIIRTGRRIPGVNPVAGVHHPIAVVRMAVGDAYGAEERREATDGDEVAFRTERVHRSVCRAVAEYSFRTAARTHARVYGGPKWTVSPVYEGMLKEEMDAASERIPGRALPAAADRRHLRGPGGRRRLRRAARDPGAEPGRRLPVRAGAGACTGRSPARSRCCWRSTRSTGRAS